MCYPTGTGKLAHGLMDICDLSLSAQSLMVGGSTNSAVVAFYTFKSRVWIRLNCRSGSWMTAKLTLSGESNLFMQKKSYSTTVNRSHWNLVHLLMWVEFPDLLIFCYDLSLQKNSEKSVFPTATRLRPRSFLFDSSRLIDVPPEHSGPDFWAVGNRVAVCHRQLESGDSNDIN